MVDLCTLVSAFGRPFGKKQTWADVSGNGRLKGDKNAICKKLKYPSTTIVAVQFSISR